MKKIVLVLAMVALAGAMSAQELSLSIKGGANMSNLTGKGMKDTKMKLGFNVGILADYEFAPNTAIQSGLYFMTKGAKSPTVELSQKFGEATISSKAGGTINTMYLQVPVHFAYKVDVAPDTRIVFHGGPYVAYGIGGKTKASVDVKTSGTVSDAQKALIDQYVKQLNATSKETDTFGKNALKPFDAGLGLGIGAEFGSFLVDLGWDMGLINISRNKDLPVKTQNAYLSVGYKF